ncbi:WXG100 family type VII secretion target [Streptomyces sp. MST-110588]|uniref:WXG100 family type VII secretion target n=1 Tax=Streptomyces sp. MST-110588 TaxID=2833628 RepID=UPI001F5DD4E3|nr:WXG100 family type VII secretion target [Streptomyces sp. MST-110588]UNO41117.1 WXG100 family type VII secretion target [Streptomyces sp. MST-110588]
MSGDESVAEQVYEAGLEIINPGGDPDTLRAAAKGWRDLHDNLQSMFQGLDGEVRRTLDSGWRGPAADAFAKHWKDLKAGMDKTLPQLPQAAKSLDEAADAIEEINDEIHQIYLEIGISIGISVGLSFLTMGFSAAAGAARAAQLAARAAKLAKTLGTILQKVGHAFKTISRLAKEHRFLKNVLVNWASNTGGTVITNALTGQETNLFDATWQGGLSAVAGTGPGLIFSRGLAKTRPLVGDIVGGSVGSTVGGLAVDGTKNLDNDSSNDVSGKNVLWDAAVNVVGGGLGGGAVHGANKHLPPGQEGPHFSVEGPAQGAVYGGTGAIGAPLHDVIVGKDSDDKKSEDTGASAAQAPKKGSVRDVFG